MTEIPDWMLNQIVTGDARELAKHIPDESIDLVFTDPVYDRIDDYRWLAETALRVLKPAGALLCWSNGRWHYQNAKSLESSGLCYRWTFADVLLDTHAPLNGRIIAKTTRVLWLDRAGVSKLYGYVPDGYTNYSNTGTKVRVGYAPCAWTKNVNYIVILLNSFTAEGGIVFDPFTGTAPIPAVCKVLGRNYIAFEIDPEVAETARRRVRDTQPPLFVLEPEQLELIPED